MKWVVPIGDMKIAQSPDQLVTDALGSCLCLTVYDPISGVGGLLHAMLPLSKINLKKAQSNPFMFVDTGIPTLFAQLSAQENVTSKGKWVVKAAGCGNPMGPKEVFKIGERNYRVLCESLLTEGVRLAAEEVGGTASRTVCLDLANGQTIVCSNGAERVL
ncbi:MAG: chemotaxis protein CheD [Desulfobacterales bacterium]|jgi:chemotaxis protein CheD|nr:chemotaxis protein CheD [Deltaproteobacteria bacterium]